ncbi:E3 ubiquitin-protein ligase RNF4-like [Ochlerotatus camptorhynchus]|uniref:E3 ubiquitin-protein ligase RNF4-like n=1 Tax=Ochlerotatus camptorhynchus TaxID=644619 RepID=UPI0031D6DC90
MNLQSGGAGNADGMDSSLENFDEDAVNESMLDVINRVQTLLNPLAAPFSPEFSPGSSTAEASTSYVPRFNAVGSESTSALSRLDSDSVVPDATSNVEELLMESRRYRADAAPEVESIIPDDIWNDLDVNLAPSPPRKRTDDPQPVPVTCPICFESVFDQQAASTICGHLFCHSCIIQEVVIRPKCPMCKRTVNLSQVIPIFIN